MSQAWPKAARLRKRPEYLEVQNRGIKASGQWLTALAKKGRLGRRRLGITVSSKVGNAVVRNRLKRWLREDFRKNTGWLPEGVDVVIIARPGADAVDHPGISKDLERLGRALKAKLASPGALAAPQGRPGPKGPRPNRPGARPGPKPKE